MSDKTDALPTYQKAMLQTVAHKHIRETINQTLKTFQLNATQWMILGVLYENEEGQKISSIAKALQVEVPLITTLAQPLLAVGHVEQHEDPNDRRSKPLSLTETGKSLVDRIESQLVDALKLLESGIDDDELTRYFQTLRIMIANGEKLEQKRRAN